MKKPIMEYFNFKSSPKRSAIRLFGLPFLFLAFLSLLTVYIVIVYISMGIAVFGIVMLIACTIGFYNLSNHCLVLKNADSDWVIIVSDSNVLWQAPRNLGAFCESSFDFHPSDIEKSILRLPIGFNSTEDEDNEYIDGKVSLVLNDGSEIPLSCQSGINLQDFTLALEKVGINEVRESKSDKFRSRIKNKDY